MRGSVALLLRYVSLYFILADCRSTTEEEHTSATQEGNEVEQLLQVATRM